MKALWLLLFLIACAVIAIAAWWLASRDVAEAPPGSTNLQTSIPDAAMPENAIPDNAQPDNAQPATVNYVHDGDTLFLDTADDSNLKTRLLAVDTPEVGDCYGAEATALLRSLAPEGSTVYTLADVEPLDQYGRSLLFVWTSDGQLINLALVSSGHAEAVFIGGNRLYEAEFEAAEEAAYSGSLGMWGAC